MPTRDILESPENVPRDLLLLYVEGLSALLIPLNYATQHIPTGILRHKIVTCHRSEESVAFHFSLNRRPPYSE